MTLNIRVRDTILGYVASSMTYFFHEHPVLLHVTSTIRTKSHERHLKEFLFYLSWSTATFFAFTNEDEFIVVVPLVLYGDLSWF